MPENKRVLLVYCHPEQRSLNGALREQALVTCAGLGWTVEESDLYRMRWKAAVDQSDFPAEDAAQPFRPGAASRRATADGTLTDDVVAEQQKIQRADAIVFQFPLWWFGPPALLKGWFDRVFSNGFAYGLSDPARGRSLRYGEGKLRGKRAMLSVTAGGLEPYFSARGVNGMLEDLLFPLTHGTLFYAGLSVLPSFAVHGANRVEPAQFEAARNAFAARLTRLFDDAAIPYRSQNGGDYDGQLCLRGDAAPGREGLVLHRADA